MYFKRLFKQPLFLFKLHSENKKNRQYNDGLLKQKIKYLFFYSENSY